MRGLLSWKAEHVVLAGPFQAFKTHHLPERRERFQLKI
jgi:hypothetical protein